MNKKVVWIARLILLVVVAMIVGIIRTAMLELPEQTEENTFNWSSYEDAIEVENVARIKRNFSGHFYITGKVIRYLSVNTDVVIITRPDGTEDSESIIVTISEDDVADIDIGDIITVYQKTKLVCGDIMGTSGRFVSFDEKAPKYNASLSN